MRIVSEYKPGDLLKYDMHFFKDHEVIHFRELNLERRSFEMAEIDPREDIFMVITPPFDREMGMSGKNRIERFITFCPLKDNLDHRKLWDIYQGQAWAFPAFMFKPADPSDLEMHVKWVGLTHGCPWEKCNRKIETHMQNNKLKFICKGSLDHKYIYAQSSDGSYVAQLWVDPLVVSYESKTQQYFCEVKDKPKTRSQHSDVPHEKIYENLNHIIKKRLLWT